MRAIVVFVSLLMPLQIASQDDGEWLLEYLSPSRSSVRQKDISGLPYDQKLGTASFDYPVGRRTSLDQEMTHVWPGFFPPRKGDSEKRFAFGGLLCCNQPPTRPPTGKRWNEVDTSDDRLRNWIFSKDVQSYMRDPSSSQPGLQPTFPDPWESYRSDIQENRDKAGSQMWDSQHNDDSLAINRRDGGVTAADEQTHGNQSVVRRRMM